MKKMYYMILVDDIPDDVFYVDHINISDEVKQDLLSCMYIANWPPNVKASIRGQIMRDVIIEYGIIRKAPIAIVSERVKDVFEKYAFDDVQFLPVLLHKNNHNLQEKFFILHTLNLVSGLDVENTHWAPSRDEYPEFAQVFSPVLIRKAIGDYDIFRLEEYRKLFVSDVIVRILESENINIKGIEFSPVRITE